MDKAEVIKVSEPYLPLYTTKKPIILITGGRGSAKSFNVSLFCKRLSYEENHVILYTRYTMTSAEKSIIPEIADKMEREGDSAYFDITAKEIINKVSDSRILFSGIKTSSGNQTANLKSIQGLTTFVADETEEWHSSEEFDKIRLSIRTKNVQNRSILVMNPSNIDHFVYKNLIENTHEIRLIDGVEVEISTHPDVCHIHTTYLDNIQNLSKEFLNEVARIKLEDPEKYAEIIIGAWARQKEGVILAKNDLRYFTPDPNRTFETSIAYADVADEGKDSNAVVFGRNIGKDIYITDVSFSKENSDITIPLVFDKIKTNDCKYIRIESNNMGAMYGRNLRTLIATNKHHCQVYSASSTTNKHTRILMDIGFIKTHCLFLAPEYQNEEYKAFMKELTSYNKDPEKNKGKHDDAPDSLSGLVIFIRSVLIGLYR
jgi:phage terminase large subunit